MEHGELEERVGILEGQVDGLIKAFPNGDVEGHRRYHEIQIEILTERRRMRAAVMEKTIGGVVWAALFATATALWQYAKEHLK